MFAPQSDPNSEHASPIPHSHWLLLRCKHRQRSSQPSQSFTPSPPSVSFLLLFPSLPQVAAGLQEVFFKTLDDLIHHYKKKNQGLAIHLRCSIKRKTFVVRSPQRAAEVPPPEEDHDYESMPSALLPHSDFLITSA